MQVFLYNAKHEILRMSVGKLFLLLLRCIYHSYLGVSIIISIRGSKFWKLLLVLITHEIFDLNFFPVKNALQICKNQKLIRNMD